MTQFETILCPIDPASPSEVGLEYAITLADWCDARITVLAVRAHGWRVGGLGDTRRGGSQAREGTSGLERRIRRFSSRPVQFEVVEGAVGRQIIRAARDLRTDLIVMGARHLGRIERLLFGSVIEHVLRHTSCAVLIVPPRAGLPPSDPTALFERIVCGVDRSLESHRALALALALGRRHLVIVHALEDFADEAPRFQRHFNTPECWRAVEPDIRADYEALVPEESRLWCAIEVVVPFGWAGGVLIQEAEARRASLVVIGTSGSHSPFGTTARHVIQRAPCPVLAVPRGGTPADRRSRAGSAATAARRGGR